MSVLVEFNQKALNNAKECVVVGNFRGFRFEGKIYPAGSLDDMEGMRRDKLQTSISGYSSEPFKKLVGDFARNRKQEVILSAGGLCIMTGDADILAKFKTRYGAIFNCFLEDAETIQRHAEQPADNDSAPLIAQYVNG